MNLLRKYKLYKLGIPIEEELLKRFESLELELSGLVEFIIPEFKSWVFYMNPEGCNVLQICLDGNFINVVNDGAWNFLNINYDANSGIGDLYKNMIENFCGVKTGLVFYQTNNIPSTIDYAYKIFKNENS